MFTLQLFNGLTLGGVYALVALGLTLVYGVLHVPNFAHGAFYMAGAYATYILMSRTGAGYWLSMLGAAGVVALIAVVAERAVFYPLRNAPPLHSMIAAIGLMLFLEAGARAMFGSDFHRMAPPYAGTVAIANATLPVQRLLIVAGAFVLVVALHCFLTRTTTGSTIVALAQEPRGAALVGINAKRVKLLVFGISGALAAVAAALYAPINLVYPTMGSLMITKAFVIIILGGMGSFPGAIVGGLLIGFAESFGGFYLSDDYKDIVAFALLVVILSVRPQGIFVTKGMRT